MEVLRAWLAELDLSRRVSNFEEDLCNGYLIGEILHAYGLLPSRDALVDKDSPAAKVSNFTAVHQPLIDLGVKFNSKIANEIMTERKGAAVNLCYQLKLGIESAKGSGSSKLVTRRGVKEPVLLSATMKSNRKPRSKFEAMQSEHFDAMVKQQVQDPKHLAEALTLSKFTETMLTQQRQAETMDELRHENWKATVQQERQLHLSKMREGKRLMEEWQAEGYEKHQGNVLRRKEEERMKLRFELNTRNRRINARTAANAASAMEVASGVDDFEKTLRKLSDGGGDEEDDAPFDGEAMARMELSAEEHLFKLERSLPHPTAMDAEARAYMERLRTRRLEEQASRKEREMRRRKVMLEQEQAQAQLEEKRREALLLAKLSRQCAEERKISAQVQQVRQEKAAMREHRAERERELAEQRRQEELARIARNRQLGEEARQQYEGALAAKRQAAAAVAAERAARKAAKHEAICRSIAVELVALGSRVADFRATTQPLLPPKVLRDWLTLFKNGISLVAPASVDTPHVEEVAPAAAAAAPPPPDWVASEAELDEYLARRNDWSPEALRAVPAPGGLSSALLAPEALVEAAVERGAAHTGRMVLELLEAAEPPPPPAAGLGLAPSLAKLAVLGRPFAGKSLVAQRLAEAHGLRVILPAEEVQRAVSAAHRHAAARAAKAAALEATPELAALDEGEEEEAPSEAALLGARLDEALCRTDKSGAPLPLPDELLVEAVVLALRAVDPVCYTGFVLDDFPRTAAQAALLEKALTGYEPPPKEPPKKKGGKAAEAAEPVEAPAAEVPAAAAAQLLSVWRGLEEQFFTKGQGTLAELRALQWQALQRLCQSRKEFVALLHSPDVRQAEVLDVQQRFNSMPTDLRLSEAGKNELHMMVSDMEEKLWALSDEKRIAAERLLVTMADDGWLGSHGVKLTLALLTLCQVEADRFVRTCGVLHSYCSFRCERTLPYEPPPLFDVPIPEMVDLYVPAPTPTDAPADGKPSKGAGKAEAAGGGGKPIPTALAGALDALAAALCAPLEPPAEPPADDGASAEAQRVAKWHFYLQQAVVGERAKLRRRLASLLRFSLGAVGELKAQVEELYAQLDQWLGERIKKEAQATRAVTTAMRKAIEAEEKLGVALQLQGETLVIDEALLLLPPPPPPPTRPPGQPAGEEFFTAPQLAALVAKLRAASAGEMLSVDAFTAVMCRLGAASFDAAELPLPKRWLPLGAPAYQRLALRYCAAGARQLGWPEVIVSLARLEPLPEEAIGEILRTAASIIAPEVVEADAEAAEPAAPAAAAPAAEAAAAPELKLTREQLAQLPLWFETGEVQPDGFSVEAALKEVLFSMLEQDGQIDLKQLLLYCCDSPAKAFAVLGYETQSMLSLDGLYELLHREKCTRTIDAPEHMDPFCYPALRRLFTQLKLGEAELVPYGLVVAHPAGAALLAQSVSYTPKGAYDLIASELASAGQALKL